MIIWLTILFSLFFLVKSADYFVDQASALAKKLKIGDFLIGLTVVAFGTSLPELISTVFSAISGHNQLTVSNIIGSNITNFCLILGVVAIFNNYRIRKRDVDINIPLNLVALVGFWALVVFMDFNLNWAAGVSLMLLFVILLILSKEYNHMDMANRKYAVFNPVILLLSLVVLVFSGKICIDQIINLANQLKISESILGYFLLAVGTSLPELVTTWIAVKKHDGELGVGNILGSNLFNLLFILGVSTFIRPINLTGFGTDLMFLSIVTLAVYAFSITGKKYSFSRNEGLGLVGVYILFAIYQISKLYID